jgi:hypothetical protein
VALLGFAVFAGGAGVTLAAVALSGDEVNAAKIQYGVADEGGGGVADEGGGGSADECGPNGEDCFGVLDESVSGGQVPATPPGGGGADSVQAERQLGNVKAGSLAFTGYLVVPALGVAGS